MTIHLITKIKQDQFKFKFSDPILYYDKLLDLYFI